MSGFKLGELVTLPGADAQDGIIARTIAGIVANGHKKVLIAGVMNDNVTEEMRRHDQLVFWRGEEALNSVPPAATALVATTRFIQHRVSERLKAYCQRENIVFVSQPLGTGQIKTLLAPFLTETKKEEARSEPPRIEARNVTGPSEVRQGFPRGQLTVFVEKHADTTVVPGTPEVKRLLALAHEQGYDVSESSMNAAFYDVRKKREDKTAVTPAPPAPIAAMPEKLAEVMDDDKELLRMLDDVSAAMELIRQTVIKRSERRRQLRELLKEI